MIRIRALIEHDGEDLLRILMGRDQPFAVGFLDGNRFFHQYVQAVLQCVDADRGMTEMRRRNEHGVNRARADEFLAARKAFGIRETREFFRGTTAHGGEFATADFAGHDILGMSQAHVAQADDSQSNQFHETCPFKASSSYADGGASSVFSPRNPAAVL